MPVAGCRFLLADFVSGMAGGGGEARASARIARIIVAGNLLAPTSSSTVAKLTAASASGAYVSPDVGARASFADRRLKPADQEALSAPMREADAWLSTLAAAAPLDLMPGEHDPASFTLPQQPMHAVLFPASARYSTFAPVSNPYDAEVGGVRLLGSSGQPVLDMARYVASSAPAALEAGLPPMAAAAAAAASAGDDDADEAAAGGAALGTRLVIAADEDEGGGGEASAAVLAAMATTKRDRSMNIIVDTGAGGGGSAAAAAEAADAAAGGANAALVRRPLSVLRHVDLLTNTLLWRHLAPTAPDTLSAYPFAGVDPFVIAADRLPHVLFAGAADAFDSRLVADAADPARTQVRIVSVPAFATTRTAVLLDISRPDFPVQPLCFRVAG